MTSPKRKVIVIVGPTGAGKTALSIQLAKEFSGEIISADSRQVYRGLDIGTEKVSEAEMDGIPHHLIDIVEPNYVYSAAEFAQDASTAIEAITNRNRLPIIAGGTFFYVDTLLGKIQAPEVPPNEALREYLHQFSTDMLMSELKRLDPIRAQNIESKNKRRLMRAIEISTALGSVPPTIITNPYNTLLIGIEIDKVLLRARLRARAEAALKRGLITETKHLLTAGVTRDRLNEIGLEYKLILSFLDNALSESELIQKLEEKNWQYAKRQLTWLKRDDTIHWFKKNDITNICALVANFLTID